MNRTFHWRREELISMWDKFLRTNGRKKKLLFGGDF